MRLNHVREQIIGAAIDVHRELGPGLLGSNHEARLQFELGGRGLQVERQEGLPVVCRDVLIDCGYRIDPLIEHRIIVELKAVPQVEPIHEAQLLSCLGPSGSHVGLSINFNLKLLRHDIPRRVNELEE
jgi:GxxExxY protein